MKKYLPFLLVPVVLLLIFWRFPTETNFGAAVVDSYSESNQNSQYSMYTTSNNGLGQSFTGDGSYLTKATFYAKKHGAPPSTIVAKLYTHSGTFGTNSVPTGAALATSDTVTANNLTTSFALVDFNFDGTYQLVANTKYVISFEYSAGDINNQVQTGIDSTSPTHAGNLTYLSSGTWAADTTDLIFYVYGTTPVIETSALVISSQNVVLTGGSMIISK
jgi:hypothetical protein